MASPKHDPPPLFLPSDVVEEIATQVYLMADLELAHQCCLICRSFRDHLQPYIFKTITVHTNHLEFSRFLKCLDDNPRLAQYIKELTLRTRAYFHNPPLLALFKRITPSLTSLRLCSLVDGRRPGPWNDLSRDTLAALVGICNLPNLRTLALGKIPNLPLEKVFKPNSGITSLVLDGCTVRTHGPLPNFAGLHHFHCSYFRGGEPGSLEWIYSIVEGSASSGNLRTLKLATDHWIDEPYFPGETLHSRPFNFTGSVNLTSLTISHRVLAFDNDRLLLCFGEFLTFLNETLSTITKSVPLETFRFAYMATFDQWTLDVEQFHEMHAWGEMWDNFGCKASRQLKFPSLKTVEFDLALVRFEEYLEATPFMASIKQLVSEDAPDVTFHAYDVTVGAFDTGLGGVFHVDISGL